MKNIWLDTDIGGDIDDACALLFLLTENDVNIVGVSTVFENTYLRAKIVKKICEMAGKPDVKVYKGIGKPYKEKVVFHDEVTLDRVPKTYIKEKFDSALIEEKDAVTALKEALDVYDDLIVTTIGALTNIAELIRLYPESARKIKELRIMGTAIGLNLNEFNISCDPEAADIVFNSGITTYITSLDCTFQCALSDSEVEMLEKCDKECVRTVLEMASKWGYGIILHDPLALVGALGYDFVEYVPGNLEVILEGVHARGKCINLMDFNWHLDAKKNFFISKSVDAKGFTKFFVDRIVEFNNK